ncbi:MAG: hypothetical protein ACPGVI_00170 [Crocinitomicaceae bacterium]
MNKVFAAIALLLLFNSCGSSRHVRSNGFIQKRKYTRGWFINSNRGHKLEKDESNESDVSDKINQNTIKPTTICVDDECTEAPITYTQNSSKLEPEIIELKETVFNTKEIMVKAIKSQQTKLNTLKSESKKAIYPRFGVNDAETTLWIGAICLLVGLVFLVLMEFTPFVLSIILLLAGSVLAMIGILNLIIGFFRSIL